MPIRNIQEDDSKDLFEWRNDLKTRKMSLQRAEVSLEEHSDWFKNSLNNPNRYFFIGEIHSFKLGVLIVDYDNKLNQSKISININPEFRRKGYGKKLLTQGINAYKRKRESTLTAEIREKNIVSKKLFISLGFVLIRETEGIIFMEKRDKLIFKKVDDFDCEILYKLLKKRSNNISHQYLPDYEKHKIFVKNNPYFKWYIVYLFGKEIGTFYLQFNNSIGININNPTKSIIDEILDFIKTNFSPHEEVSSQIPSYFYVNIADTNQDLIDIMRSLELSQIQVTFKLN